MINPEVNKALAVGVTVKVVMVNRNSSELPKVPYRFNFHVPLSRGSESLDGH